VLVHKLIDSVPNERVVPLRTQIKGLGNIKIGGAHLATMFTLAGHYTFYAYFTPFLETTLHLSQNWISITYFIFGIVDVSVSALGGSMVYKIGVQKSILIVIDLFAIALFILPYMTFSFPLFLIMMLVW